MSKSKPIHRLEETPGGLRVVTKDLRDLYDYRSANVLEREYPALFTSCVPKQGGRERDLCGGVDRRARAVRR